MYTLPHHKYIEIGLICQNPKVTYMVMTTQMTRAMNIRMTLTITLTVKISLTITLIAMTIDHDGE